MTTCKKCGALIEFRRTANDRFQPIDVEGGEVHFATCPARPQRLLNPDGRSRRAVVAWRFERSTSFRPARSATRAGARALRRTALQEAGDEDMSHVRRDAATRGIRTPSRVLLTGASQGDGTPAQGAYRPRGTGSRGSHACGSSILAGTRSLGGSSSTPRAGNGSRPRSDPDGDAAMTRLGTVVGPTYLRSVVVRGERT